MELSTLQNLEASGSHAHIEKYLAGALKKAPDLQTLKYASAYYVRRGNPVKSLACYGEYLARTPAGARDLDAIALAIDCARRLGKHTLVRDYFMTLTAAERAELSPLPLMHAAASLIALGLLDEADKIIRFMRQREGVGQLPDFDTLIAQKFGGREKVHTYIATTPARLQEADEFMQVRHALTLALAHMAEGNYTAAEKVLGNCKAQIAA